MVSSFADDEDRIVVTKDRDFEVGHLIGGVPKKLLLVTTGNIIELSSDAVTIRGGPGR